MRAALLVSCLFLAFTSCGRPAKQKNDWQTHYQSLKASRKPLPIVVLDPGHGGESAGTKTVTTPSVAEKALSLKCALKVRDFLQDWGYPVRMTRTKDETVTLPKRVAFAKQQKGYLFVSIHFNHAPRPEAHGVEVFYYDNPSEVRRTERSKLLAKDVLRFIVRETDAYSRGVHNGNFHVIRENSLPAILIEGGFCSNAREAKKLVDPKYSNKLAYAIARGIDNFIQHDLEGVSRR